MSDGGKIISSFGKVAAAGLASVLCVVATPLLAQEVNAPKPAPSKSTAQRSGATPRKSSAKAAAPPPSAKQRAPAKVTDPTTAKAAPASPPAPPAQTRLAPLPPVDTSTPPPVLPRASRERMRACAEEWEKKKRASTSALPMWREFATGCLTRRS